MENNKRIEPETKRTERRSCLF